VTTANKITITRILLAPVFVFAFLAYVRTGDEWKRFAAVIVFAVAILSDGLDGYVARHFNQRSALGAFLDPLADKLLLVSGLVLLTLNWGKYFFQIPLWLTAFVLGRDIVVALGVLIVRTIRKEVILRPTIAGKTGTVLQMGMLFWILFQWTERALPFWIWGAAILALISAVEYAVDGFGQLRRNSAVKIVG
jgi:CDP-diacylglycerol--glycerol-3-phosphate 3-phosphatidyltransferase